MSLAPSFPPVARLCRSGSPTTICWTIWAVVVFALDRVLRARTWPHICVEIFERTLPSLAYGYSASTIVVPTAAIPISAARSHGGPNGPFRTDFRFPRHAVGGDALAGYFCSEATATNAVSVPKCGSIDCSFSSAIALAQPKAKCMATNNRPSAKSATGHFYECRHNVKVTT